MSPAKGLLIPLLIVAILSGCRCNLDIAFILDVSGHINRYDPSNWRKLQDFIYSIILQLPEDCTWVAVVGVGDIAYAWFYWSQDRNLIKRTVFKQTYIPSYKPAAIESGLHYAINNLFLFKPIERQNTQNVAVVIVHSRTNNITSTINIAYQLHNYGVKMICIGVTNQTDPNQIKAMSSPPRAPGTDYFQLHDFSDLSGVHHILVDNIMNYNRINFQEDLDIGFIIDASSSISHKGDWRKLLDFVVALINGFPRRGTRVGVIVFTGYAHVLITFDRFEHLCKIQNKIHELQVTNVSGKTNTSGALYIARTYLFNVAYGDRPNAPNVAIVITDGRSDVDEDMTLRSAGELHEHGVKVICIGVTDKINEGELKSISSPPHQRNVNYFMVHAFKNLGEIIVSILTYIDTSNPTAVSVHTTEPSFTSGLETTDASSPGSTPILPIVLPVFASLAVLIVISLVLYMVCIHQRKRRKVAETAVPQQQTELGHPDILHSTTIGRDTDTMPREEAIGDGDFTHHTYEEILEGNQGPVQLMGSKETSHTYQHLNLGYAPSTFENWLNKNNISKTIALRLKEEKIKTIRDLQLLTERDIDKLSSSIGDANHLRDALKKL